MAHWAIVMKLEPVIARKTSFFPAVSVCISKDVRKIVSNERVEHFVRTYYAEHNIPEPQQ